MYYSARHKIAQAFRFVQLTSEGGARLWRVRGRALELAAVAAGVTCPAQADNLLSVPSGQPVELSNVLLDTNQGELWARFRFVAPKIGSTAGRISHDAAVIDMEHLCQTLVIPYVAQHDLKPARVVISFSDRPIAFGTSEPDATQFFEAYRVEQAKCIWEGL